MIDAKLEGEGIDLEADAMEVKEPSNVVDLMAALKKSLGQSSSDRPAQSKRKKTEDVRQTRSQAADQGWQGGG